MEETESNFKELLVDFSRWYDGLGYINMLKVLYTDHVPDYTDLIGATKGMPLLQKLIGSGNLSSTNLGILYDTIKVTGQFGFKSKIVLQPLQRLEEHKVSKFTRYKQFLLKLGMKLTREDIDMLDARHNDMPLLKDYKDSWHLILHLEQRKGLCEENIGNFIEGLPSYLAVKALLEDSREASTSKRPMLSEGNEEPSTSKRPKLNEGFPSISANSAGLSDEDKVIREYLLSRQLRVCRNAKCFTPATWNTAYHLDIADMFTDLDLLKEGAMNDVVGECSSRRVKLELERLDIFGNNFSNIDVSSFISLFITPKLNVLNLINYSLSSDIINDIVRECSSRGIKFELQQLNISDNNLSNIDWSSFTSLFITPKLSTLNMRTCNLFGDILNDSVRMCSSRGVKLVLKKLIISDNNLSEIDGSSFASLFITPKLNMLDLSDCNLSGDIINDMIRECLSRGVKLELQKLDISGNNLSSIDVSLFASVFVTPKLSTLNMSNCSLSGDIINNMISVYSSRGFKLELQQLYISSNKLSTVDGASLASLFITSKLNVFHLKSCILSGDIIDDMVRECSSMGVKLKLKFLNISGNRLCNIDGSSFASLFITPKLSTLNMRNCSLSGDIINYMVSECSSTEVKLELQQLYISSNNLSTVDGSSFASLFITPKLNVLVLNDCSLSGDIINDMVRECSSREVKLKLKFLDISGTVIVSVILMGLHLHPYSLHVN
ncbi:uncharacterized protein LOC117120514 isoform X2 [Anneissia japonica]|uniref:uncharacterized protein LOC117120514 isoform X2 n=1 Tax=Anneissia japonica TaxID=1529436 RepID=UPI001425881D|nr:uncharacterized protein LOC117120514 isoform X2 [Anneissia japonica]